MNSKTKFLLLFIAIVFFTSGCGSQEKILPPVLDSASPAAFEPPLTTPSPLLIEILQISEILSIQLDDNDSSYIDYSPANARYILHPKSEEFLGQVTFNVGGYFRNTITDTEDINIPLSSIEAFLNKLAYSPLKEGEYEPPIWLDNYRNLEIHIELRTKAFVFYSSSPDKDYVPWAVSINNKTYVINSNVPMQALLILDRYLKKDKFEQLKDQVLNSPPPNFNSTPTP